MGAVNKARYLCRLCKKEYNTGATAGRLVAAKETLLMLHGLGKPDTPELIAVHYCDNGGIGVADLIGWERVDEQKPKEAARTNYEYLRTLEHYEMANAILNIGEDPCQLCPRDKEDRCNEDCNNGLVEWLASPVNPDDPVWTKH